MNAADLYGGVYDASGSSRMRAPYVDAYVSRMGEPWWLYDESFASGANYVYDYPGWGDPAARWVRHARHYVYDRHRRLEPHRGDCGQEHVDPQRHFDLHHWSR